jgi:hypothetical protein
MKKIKDPWIAKEKFKYISDVKEKLSHEKWVEYIDAHKDYYLWFEETELGIDLSNKLRTEPEVSRLDFSKELNKTIAKAEYNEKKGNFDVILTFSHEYGTIGSTFNKKISNQHIVRLIDLAKFLDAYVLNNGKQIIDETFLEL